MNRPFRACILGAFVETTNMGVSALAVSLAGLILNAQPEANIFFFVGRRSGGKKQIRVCGRPVTAEILNFRLSPRAVLGDHLFWLLLLALLYRLSPSSWLRKRIVASNRRLQAIHECDFIGDIRGGDSFSDIYGLRRFLIGSVPSLIVLLLGKELVLLPQTYGPYGSRTARAVAGWILKNSRCILSRDEEGLAQAAELAGAHGRNGRVRFCPDVAFTLEPVEPPRVEITPALAVGEGPVIGLNVSGLLYRGGYSGENMFGLRMDYAAFVHELARTLLRETTARLLLVPHCFGPPGSANSDPDACRSVFSGLDEAYRDRVHILEGSYDQSEMKGIIGRCDFFAGSRMHACIAALSQGIPTVGIAYSRKFKGVFKSAGAERYVADARELDQDTLTAQILGLYEEGFSRREDILKQMETVKGEVRRIFGGLLAPGSI